MNEKVWQCSDYIPGTALKILLSEILFSESPRESKSVIDIFSTPHRCPADSNLWVYKSTSQRSWRICFVSCLNIRRPFAAINLNLWLGILQCLELSCKRILCLWNNLSPFRVLRWKYYSPRCIPAAFGNPRWTNCHFWLIGRLTVHDFYLKLWIEEI